MRAYAERRSRVASAKFQFIYYCEEVHELLWYVGHVSNFCRSCDLWPRLIIQIRSHMWKSWWSSVYEVGLHTKRVAHIRDLSG